MKSKKEPKIENLAKALASMSSKKRKDIKIENGAKDNEETILNIAINQNKKYNKNENIPSIKFKEQSNLFLKDSNKDSEFKKMKIPNLSICTVIDDILRIKFNDEFLGYDYSKLDHNINNSNHHKKNSSIEIHKIYVSKFNN